LSDKLKANGDLSNNDSVETDLKDSADGLTDEEVRIEYYFVKSILSFTYNDDFDDEFGAGGDRQKDAAVKENDIEVSASNGLELNDGVGANVDHGIDGGSHDGDIDFAKNLDGPIDVSLCR
jgi:hypothetical protein